MSRTWAMLGLAAGLLAIQAIGASRADDEEDSPLARIMKKIDVETKAIKDATSTIKKFRAAGNGKAVVASARVLMDLGKETRKFDGPSKAMKKPFAKWTELTDGYIKSAEEVAQTAEKGDLVAARKAYTALNLTCSNCHGAFRPSVGDDF